MNSILLSLVIISSPWHFGIELGWSAGLYGFPEEQAVYLNPNTHVYVEAERPAIPPPGFFHLGLSLEDEKSIGFTADLVVHYKNYTAEGFIDSIGNLNLPGLPNRIDATQDIPYSHTQFAWGLQKTLGVTDGRVLFPLGIQLTHNWFIPAVTQELVEEYVEELAYDIPAWTAMLEDPQLAIEYVRDREKRTGMRFNLGLMAAPVKVEGFSWLLGMGFDFNFLFKPNGNDVSFYPEFGLSTGFRF